MRIVWLGVCLALAASLSLASGEVKEPAGGKPSPLEPGLERAFGRLGETPSMLSFQAALQQLKQAYPERVFLESYGKSRQGRSLHRLRVLPWDGDLARPRTGQPAVVLIPELGGAPQALPMLREIAKHMEDKQAGTSFEWIAYPLPDPDAWVAGENLSSGRGRVHLDRNFPAGWSPWTPEREHPGSAPLSEPEVRSLANSLVQCRRAVAVILWGDGEQGPPGGPPGSLRRHAKVSLGLSVHAFSGAAEWGQILQSIEVQRPKLEVSVHSTKRLSQDLHLVDLLVQNRGHGMGDLSDVDLGITGGTCLKLAWAHGEGADHVQLDSQSLPSLVAGAQPMRVRLVLRVSDPESLVVHLDAPQIQGVSLPLPMGNRGTATR